MSTSHPINPSVNRLARPRIQKKVLKSALCLETVSGLPHCNQMLWLRGIGLELVAEPRHVLIQDDVIKGNGTVDVWFDEKLIKGSWAPPNMPRVIVFNEQTDEETPP